VPTFSDEGGPIVGCGNMLLSNVHEFMFTMVVARVNTGANYGPAPRSDQELP
jgi:hypothetical protein